MAILPENGTRPQTEVRGPDLQPALVELAAKLTELERTLANAIAESERRAADLIREAARSKPAPRPRDAHWLMVLAYVLAVGGFSLAMVVASIGVAVGGAR